MPLEFHNDAIVLSGLLGTKLKSKIIHDYYKLWWKITSGGRNSNYSYQTSIVEMNAATGEIYIKETDEIILGSAGCALNLKFNKKFVEKPNLALILVENDETCIEHLKNIIKRRFPQAKINDDLALSKGDFNQCVLIRRNVNDAIDTIDNLNIKGRSIYFFDPLLCIEMELLRTVYEKRIESPFFSGVEFLIFFFTSDWIYGRNDFKPLPNNKDSKTWNDDEKLIIELLSDVLGDHLWYNKILTNEHPDVRMKKLIGEYQERLYKLFRIVIPTPFAPKKNQIYHLIFCTNYHAGGRIMADFYKNSTINEWNPNNRIIYKEFEKLHRLEIHFPGGSRRPTEWKILWRVIKNYRFGKFDDYCRDLREIESNPAKINKAFKWLTSKGYIRKYERPDISFKLKPRFELNWSIITRNLGLDEPAPLEPLRDVHFLNTKIM